MKIATGRAHSPAQLCQVRIELDLSKNSRLKDMFRQPEFHREITIYLRHCGLEISNRSTNSQGRIIQIEVTGSPVALESFIDRYLRADVSGIAYNLEHLQETNR
jgi:hypothetical protein